MQHYLTIRRLFLRSAERTVLCITHSAEKSTCTEASLHFIVTAVSLCRTVFRDLWGLAMIAGKCNYVHSNGASESAPY